MDQRKKERIKQRVLSLLKEAEVHYLPIDPDALLCFLQVKAVTDGHTAYDNALLAHFYRIKP